MNLEFHDSAEDLLSFAVLNPMQIYVHFIYLPQKLKGWRYKGRKPGHPVRMTSVTSWFSWKTKLHTYRISSEDCGPVPQWNRNTQFPRFKYLSNAILKLVQSCVKMSLILSSCAPPVVWGSGEIRHCSKTCFIKIRENNFPSADNTIGNDSEKKKKKHHLVVIIGY